MKTHPYPLKKWNGNARRFFVLIPILLVIMACSLPLGGPSAPTDRTPLAETPIGDMISALQNAQVGEEFHLEITEFQLTRLLLDALPGQQANIEVTNPSVVLRNDQMEVYGHASTDVIGANFQVVLTIGVDENGNLVSDVRSADFGGVPVPESIRSRLEEALDDSLRTALNPYTARFRLTQAVVRDGLLVLTGEVR